MSETVKIKPLTAVEKKARAKDISARKGHLLGLLNPKDPGYVPAMSGKSR